MYNYCFHRAVNTSGEMLSLSVDSIDTIVGWLEDCGKKMLLSTCTQLAPLRGRHALRRQVSYWHLTCCPCREAHQDVSMAGCWTDFETIHFLGGPLTRLPALPKAITRLSMSINVRKSQGSHIQFPRYVKELSIDCGVGGYTCPSMQIPKSVEKLIWRQGSSMLRFDLSKNSNLRYIDFDCEVGKHVLKNAPMFLDTLILRKNSFERIKHISYSITAERAVVTLGDPQTSKRSKSMRLPRCLKNLSIRDDNDMMLSTALPPSDPNRLTIRFIDI